MKMRFFDFEVLPNWWLCVFADLDTDTDLEGLNENCKDKMYVVHSDMDNARDLLVSHMRERGYTLIGYNIKNYDLAIANAIYQGFTPREIKVVNDIIINPGCAWSTKEHIRLSPFAKKKLSGICFQDLMDDGAGSLKEKEATLGLSVLESSVDFNKVDLTEEDKADLIYYCRQDVYASMQFYAKVVHPYTLTKMNLGKHFGIDEDTCHKSTNAKLVSMALGAVRKHHDDAEEETIELPAKIRQYCYDNLPADVIDRIRTNRKGFETVLFDNKVSFGNGGIHSTYIGNFSAPPCIYCETDSEYALVNVDAESYYPSLMIQLNLLSRNVSNPQRFTDIFNERMQIKHKAQKTLEDDQREKADKLVLNTTFGASGNKYIDLYDPYMCTSVCRTGQIFLGALANKIHKTIRNAKIIQSNTDGILCYLPKTELPKLDALQKEWTDISGINMERDDFVKIWQRDVNNYLAVVMKNGKEKVKRKGGWLNDDYFRPGYVTTASANAFVCSKAIIDFLLYDKDIVKSIVNNNNIADFTIGCTKGPTFRGVVQRLADGTEIQLFKANRVIASKDTSLGKLYKYKMYKGQLSYSQMPSIPDHCMLVNDDLSHYDFNKLKKDIDYMYYITRCADLLDMTWYELAGTDLYKTDRFNYFD